VDPLVYSFEDTVLIRIGDMTKAKPTKSPADSKDREGTELPIASPKVADTTKHPTQPPEPDPLAKWRAAREMEEEMADIFDEDRVTHRHGGAEPEAD
jgi:hypothetical protein